MHFDQRTQTALRDAGLDTDDLRAASDRVASLVDDDAAALVAFFDAHDTVYSDMDMAHAASEYPEHDVAYCDVTTHAAEMRGWLRFDTWGAYVEDGRILERTDGDDATTGDEPFVVELSLGPSVHDRVRFAPTREALE
ncbi:hypothetical protein G9C85_10270 [Halorubellus sp. JP-L1]|uniref:DUF7532 family protein n=1 Tax=Halorubellus sp. JP-L1 TaxID=2715753 RepID=UPI00140BA52D|nr:hypothetical protein [Halorubellus sp. JP-L1]NHN42011.1 hypothetical protein [Halorubellus sp. JP-L1]